MTNLNHLSPLFSPHYKYLLVEASWLRPNIARPPGRKMIIDAQLQQKVKELSDLFHKTSFGRINEW